ncbi:helix-turn-helix transcriptional regulator [Paenibacillus sp. FJAT-26967]|uniref:helix-turn-helix transcriptional regulator n=1 Tax=Paenibacillus sp. FJAT-26967 TaxID=1729690 RepID=UPI000838F081
MALSPRQARELCGLSQQQVADRLGVPRQTYMKWERNANEMPLDKAKEFSEIVGIRIDEIFFD